MWPYNCIRWWAFVTRLTSPLACPIHNPRASLSGGGGVGGGVNIGPADLGPYYIHTQGPSNVTTCLDNSILWILKNSAMS